MDRFWSKVNKASGLGPNGDCWLWTAAKNNMGYGKFCVRKPQIVYAHRYSWTMANGPIPDGMNVLHRCDTPLCVRPDHLFLGTLSDNMRDMYAKGRNYHVNKPWRLPTGERSGRHTMPERTARGERASKAKLTAAQVLEIRSMYNTGRFSQQALAELFDVSQRAISSIVRRTVWTHI